MFSFIEPNNIHKQVHIDIILLLHGDITVISPSFMVFFDINIHGMTMVVVDSVLLQQVKFH